MKIRCFSCMHEFDAEYGICPDCGYDIDSYVDERALRPSTWLKNGRYYVGRVLGIGGFAITYIAWDDELDTMVAIKEYFPSDWATRDPETQIVEHGSGYEERENFFGGKNAFINESKVLATVGTLPGIVSVYDRFEEYDTAYIVMEFVPGEDLGVILRRDGTYTYSDAIKILLPVMRSMAKVHGKGIVHKDIAPDNIMFCDGKVKLIDFGASASAFSMTEGITLKPGYAPPEQYEENRIPTPAMDVYAMGAVLYHLITGLLPPESTKRQKEIEDGNDDPLADPDTCQLTKEKLPDGLFEIIRMAMDPDESKRIGNTMVLADLLERYVVKEDAKEIHTGESKSKLLKIVIPVIAVLLAAVIGVSVTMVKVSDSKNDASTVAVVMKEMPDLQGLTAKKAKAKIAKKFPDLKFTVSEKTVKAASKDLNKQIAKQTPEAGDFDLNSTKEVVVYLYEYDKEYAIDNKNKKVTVPDVSGMTKAKAEKALKNAGLVGKIATNEKYDDDVAEGKVISQSVKKGKVVKASDTITLTISKGVEPTTATTTTTTSTTTTTYTTTSSTTTTKAATTTTHATTTTTTTKASTSSKTNSSSNSNSNSNSKTNSSSNSNSNSKTNSSSNSNTNSKSTPTAAPTAATTAETFAPDGNDADMVLE